MADGSGSAENENAVCLRGSVRKSDPARRPAKDTTPPASGSLGAGLESLGKTIDLVIGENADAVRGKKRGGDTGSRDPAT